MVVSTGKTADIFGLCYYLALPKHDNINPPNNIFNYGVMYVDISQNPSWQHAFSIYNRIMEISSRLYSLTGWKRGQVKVYYPNNLVGNVETMGYVDSGGNLWEKIVKSIVASTNTIYIASDYWASGPYSYDGIAHEYGHAVMDSLYGGIPRGSYAGDHSFYQKTDPIFAFVEGWANFFSNAMRNNRYLLNYDVETLPRNADADKIEGYITSILWDIYDAANDDPLNLGFDEIFNILKNYKPKTIHEFWDHWLFSANYNYRSALNTIFWNAGIDKNEAPTCSITSPNAGGWYSGVVTVTASTFDVDGTVSQVEFQYSTDKVTWYNIGSDSSPPWSYSWSTSSLISEDSSVWVRARAYDGMEWGPWDECDVPFGIDNTPPSYSGQSPTGGTKYDNDPTNIRLQITWTDSVSGVTSVKFRYKYGADASWSSWLNPSSSSGNTYWYDIPRSEWSNYVGKTIYWESYAVNGARASKTTSTFTGPMIVDDGATNPSCSNPSASPGGTIYDNSDSIIRFMVYWSDPSGISDVKFEFWKDSINYHAFSWSGRNVDSNGNGWYWFDMPPAVWKSLVGYKIYWASYAWDNDIDRPNDISGPASTDIFEGPSILDDDSSPPSGSNVQPPDGTVVSSEYMGNIRISVNWVDSLSGIYQVRFYYKYGSGSWLERSPSGQSGSTYWYDIPRSEWSQHIGETIYWYSKAWDNDNDRTGDQLTAEYPLSINPYKIIIQLSKAQQKNIYLVVRGMNDGIYYRVYGVSSGSWGSWSALPGATCDSPASVVCCGRLHLVVRGMDGSSLWYSSVDLATNTFSGWSRLSGSTPSAPTLTSDGVTLYLIVRGLNNQIYYRSYANGAWGNWQSVPSGATCDSPAVTIIDSQLHLVVRGIDGQSLWHAHINLSTSSFSGWTKISGATNSTPTLTR
ncbi:MAG: Ig-like domain-containing protein [Nitrososphaeria archaeon]